MAPSSAIPKPLRTRLLGPLATLPVLFLGLCSFTVPTHSQPFALPTSNRALFEPGGGDRFLVGTAGKPWTSGSFGCVRTEGYQMHEGLDIRCMQRDHRGEPSDPITATADGRIAYINHQASLSSYGIYLVLQHRVDGLEIYSLYAHLAEVKPGLKPGQIVRQGEVLATMGRTANTRQRITADRAHLHFELNFLVNERFETWHRKNLPGQRNDHRLWNGRNFLGIDPAAVLLSQIAHGTNFSLRRFVQARPELCRVAVRATAFPWLKRYAPLLQPNPLVEREGVAGYELVLDYTGLPFQIIPKSASQLPGKGRVTLLSVNEPEQRAHPCRKLLTQRSGRWELTNTGSQLLDLLLF